MDREPRLPAFDHTSGSGVRRPDSGIRNIRRSSLVQKNLLRVQPVLPKCVNFRLRACLKPHTLVYISARICHYFCFSSVRNGIFSVIALTLFALVPVAHSQHPPALLQSNLRFVPPRPNAPPVGVWNFNADTEESDGKVRKLHGHAEIEGNTLLFRADEIEFNDDTGDLHATGSVYYHNFVKNEQIWADHIDYNTKEEIGKFYSGDTQKVHGETTPRIDSRPGILTTNNPFYFERSEEHTSELQ